LTSIGLRELEMKPELHSSLGMEVKWLSRILRIFLPFACAYFLSYLLRNINAVIAPGLVHDFGLDAGQLGSLTAAYFLGFAAMQIPIGVCLDRFSPTVVQASLFTLAAAGATLFSAAHSSVQLLAARFVIGVGVAAGLVAGLMAIALWFPKDRVPLANGAFIAVGTLGAVAATAPTEWVLTGMDWRGVFQMIAICCALVAVCVVTLAPRAGGRTPSGAGPVASRKVFLPGSKIGLRSYSQILRDARFWRLAPLSGTSIGSAWALQGLWAGPWLSDVAGFNRPTLVAHLFIMSLALSSGALGLGIIIQVLKRVGIGPTKVLPALVTLLMLAELLLALRQPVPVIVPWCLIALMGAGTVATYSITADLFEKSTLGRVNGSVNLFHIGGAFVLQTSVGFIIARWSQVDSGHYPPGAYTFALLFLVLAQLLALIWYLRPLSAPRIAVAVPPERTVEGLSSA
jgi:MFS family permease